MKNIQTLLFLILLSFSISIKLKTRCAAKGFDCDWETRCCHGFCVDDRCVEEEADDTLKFATEGGVRCDWFHYCPDGKLFY